MFAGLRPTAIPILLLTANVGKGSKGAASRAAAFASTPSRKGTSHVAQAIDRHSGRASPTWDSRLPGGSSATQRLNSASRRNRVGQNMRIASVRCGGFGMSEFCCEETSKFDASQMKCLDCVARR
jgi:hypothetical protein